MPTSWSAHRSAELLALLEQQLGQPAARESGPRSAATPRSPAAYIATGTRARRPGDGRGCGVGEPPVADAARRTPRSASRHRASATPGGVWRSVSPSSVTISRGGVGEAVEDAQHPGAMCSLRGAAHRRLCARRAGRGGRARRGQVQPLGDRGDHLLRRLRARALLESRVVVGRHVAQRRDLLAAEAGRSAAAGRGQAHVLGLQGLAAAAEELGQLRSVHGPRSARVEPGTDDPCFRGPRPSSRGWRPRPSPTIAHRRAALVGVPQRLVQASARREGRPGAGTAGPVEPAAPGVRARSRPSGREPGGRWGAHQQAPPRQRPDEATAVVSSPRPISGRAASRLVGATPGWARLLVTPQPRALLRRSSSRPNSPKAILDCCRPSSRRRSAPSRGRPS